MIKSSGLYLFCQIVLLFMMAGSCKKKSSPSDPPEPTCESTYTRDVKPIVVSKCAVSGCHVANFPFGDFSTYGDLKTRIDNGKVNRLVFEQQLMPPANSPRLTGEELDKLKCWIDHGAAQN